MLRRLAPVLLSLLVPTVAWADTHKVPSQFDTIQEALDAAEAGDTVLIAGGSYTVDGLELDAGKDGVMIRGKGKVFIDGPILPPDVMPMEELPPALLILSNGVTIKNLRFRHADEDAVVVGADGDPVQGFTMDRCVVRNGRESGLVAFADDVLVKNSRFRGCRWAGILVTGSRAELTRLRLEQLGQYGATVTGDDLVYTKNLMKTVEDGQGLTVNGDRALVDRSAFFGVQQQHVLINGNDGVIRRSSMTLGDRWGIEVIGNSVEIDRVQADAFGDMGVKVTGTGARLSKVAVGNIATTGISVEGAQAHVTRSRVMASRFSAMVVTGDGATVEGNTVFGGDSGFRVTGADVLVTRNVVLAAGDDATGLRVSGDAAEVTFNRVKEANGDGISVSTDMGTISFNLVADCGAEDESGLRVSGSDNRIENNRVTGCDATGLRIHGSRNLALLNTLIDNSDNGIWLLAGELDPGPENTANVLERNVCSDNGGEGVQNDAAGTELIGNRLRGNRIDLTNRLSKGATIIDGGGNSFGSGGPDVEPEIGVTN